jgi:acyl dehydratase
VEATGGDPHAVGQEFTAIRECERWLPIYYAAASGDFNPIHIDREMGEAAGLGGNILQGLCTLSWAAEVAVEFLGHPVRLEGIKVRFSKPVAPGDTVTFTGRVTARTGARVEMGLSAVNQRGEEVLKNASLTAVLDRTLQPAAREV